MEDELAGKNVDFNDDSKNIIALRLSYARPMHFSLR